MPGGRRPEYKGQWRNVIPLMGADNPVAYANRMLTQEAMKNREVTEFLVSPAQHERLLGATVLFGVPVRVVEPDDES